MVIKRYSIRLKLEVYPLNRIKRAAELLVKEGYDDEIISLLEAAISEQESIVAYHNLAAYLTENDKYEEALLYAEKAVAMGPKTYFPLALLGELYLRSGRKEEAQFWLEKSYALQTSPTVANNLAILYKEQQHYTQAAEYFLNAFETEDYACMYAVHCYVLAGDMANATKWIDVISKEEDRFIGEVELAELYALVADYEKAKYWYKQGFRHYSTICGWVSDYLWVLYKLDEKSEAEKVYEAYLKELKQELAQLPEEAKEYEWSKEDLFENIHRLEGLIRRAEVVQSETQFSPEVSFNIASRCYTFFCPMHDQKFGEAEIMS